MKTSVLAFSLLSVALLSLCSFAVYLSYVALDVITVKAVCLLLLKAGDTSTTVTFPSALAPLHNLLVPLGNMSLSQFTLVFVITTFALVLFIALLAGSSAGNLSPEFPFAFRAAAFLRTPIMMFIVVPLSYIRRNYNAFEIWYDLTFPDSHDSHDDRVRDIVRQVKAWNANGRKTKLRTARPNWASMSVRLGDNKGNAATIAFGHMNRILDVNYDALTIKCEPGVTMGQITHDLVHKGYALQVQIEMESITMGGVSMGLGMETNCHRVGLFQESVLQYELVTSTGMVLQVTKDSDPELFYALPSSHGTLGFLTAVTVKMTKTKPFVYMKYVVTRSPKELQRVMKTESESPTAPDFLEATIYSRDVAVVQMANFIDGPRTAAEKAMVNPINHFTKPFFYKHVETFIEKGSGEEIIPLMDYYHRFTRSVFWELEDMIPFSNHPLYRYLWGWMGAPEVALLKLFQGPVIRKASVYAHVVQEAIVPVSSLAEGVDKFDEWFGVYPLLVFPLRFYHRKNLSGFFHPDPKHCVEGKDWGIWVDIGAYGAPREVKEGKQWDAKGAIRRFEHWNREKGGWQACYTDMFCTAREFRECFDHSLLDKCRARLQCVDAFPEVFEKVKPEAGIVDLTAELAAEQNAAMAAFYQNAASTMTSTRKSSTKGTAKTSAKGSTKGSADSRKSGGQSQKAINSPSGAIYDPSGSIRGKTSRVALRGSNKSSSKDTSKSASKGTGKVNARK